jgi:hypothetical protein
VKYLGKNSSDYVLNLHSNIIPVDTFRNVGWLVGLNFMQKNEKHTQPKKVSNPANINMSHPKTT